MHLVRACSSSALPSAGLSHLPLHLPVSPSSAPPQLFAFLLCSATAGVFGPSTMGSSASLARSPDAPRLCFLAALSVAGLSIPPGLSLSALLPRRPLHHTIPTFLSHTVSPSASMASLFFCVDPGLCIVSSLCLASFSPHWLFLQCWSTSVGGDTNNNSPGNSEKIQLIAISCWCLNKDKEMDSSIAKAILFCFQCCFWCMQKVGSKTLWTKGKQEAGANNKFETRLQKHSLQIIK